VGFDTKLFFKWLQDNNLTPYACTFEWFIQAINGTTLEILIKFYDKTRKFEEDILSLKKELEDTKLREEYNATVAKEVMADCNRLERELEQQRFNNKHNLSIDQTIANKIQKLRSQVSTLTDAAFWNAKAFSDVVEQNKIMEEALEKIEDPRKIGHTERDEYTQKACLMNVAHVALKRMRGEHVEI
jgi:hypothetical protein